jgi:hypothetical protein
MEGKDNGGDWRGEIEYKKWIYWINKLIEKI